MEATFIPGIRSIHPFVKDAADEMEAKARGILQLAVSAEDTHECLYFTHIAADMIRLASDIRPETLLYGGEVQITPSMIDEPKPAESQAQAQDEAEAAPEKPKRTRKAKTEKPTAKVDVPEEANDYSDIDDELWNKALEVIFDSGLVSVAQLQRKLKVGYVIGEKLLQRMEDEEIVSAYDGSNPRQLLTTKQRYFGLPDDEPENLVDDAPPEEETIDISLEDLRAKLREAQLAGRLNQDALRAVFQQHGVSNLTAFPAMHYGKLLALIGE